MQSGDKFGVLKGANIIFQRGFKYIADIRGSVGNAPRAARTNASLGRPFVIRRCLPGALSGSLLNGVAGRKFFENVHTD